MPRITVQRLGRARTAKRGAALALAFAFAGAVQLHVSPALADEPERVEVYDPGAYPPPTTRFSLLAAGAATTAVWYGGSVGASYLWPDAPGARDLRIPVAGPWIALADTGCPDADPDCSTFSVVLRAILTTMSGVGQAGGLFVIGEALFLPTREPPASGVETRARSHVARRTRIARATGVELRPVPFTHGRDGVGLSVFGQF